MPTLLQTPPKDDIANSVNTPCPKLCFVLPSKVNEKGRNHSNVADHKISEVALGDHNISSTLFCSFFDKEEEYNTGTSVMVSDQLNDPLLKEV
jgi:hypothetical protein